MTSKTAITTKIIGLKQFRSNITSLWKKARAQNIRYIVMHHTMPVFEVNPIHEDELLLKKIAADVKLARAQYKRGEFYTQDEVRKKLGL